MTHFLHLSHALLTLVLSLSSLRRFVGGDRCSLDPAFEGVVTEVAAPSVRSPLRLAATHDVGLAAASGCACGGLIPFIANEDQSISDVRGGPQVRKPGGSRKSHQGHGRFWGSSVRISAALLSHLSSVRTLSLASILIHWLVVITESRLLKLRELLSIHDVANVDPSPSKRLPRIITMGRVLAWKIQLLACSRSLASAWRHSTGYGRNLFPLKRTRLSPMRFLRPYFSPLPKSAPSRYRITSS